MFTEKQFEKIKMALLPLVFAGDTEAEKLRNQIIDEQATLKTGKAYLDADFRTRVEG
jgi:hypothetical protein